MAIGQKAWEGINILVFGRTPLIPMQLEQDIASANPGIEVQLESFEDYFDALDFTKNEKNIGFFLIVDDEKKPNPVEIFKNLSKPYSTSGWPPFASLIYEKEKNATTLEKIAFEKGFLNYLPLKDFSDTQTCRNHMLQLWTTFVERTVENLIPRRLEQSIISIANSKAHPGSLIFREQLTDLLTVNLDLSWKDLIVLRWAYPFQLVNANFPQVFAPHGDLIRLLGGLTQSYQSDSNLKESLRLKSASLLQRSFDLICYLDQARILKQLDKVLAELGAEGKPGSPAIFRILNQNKDKILKLANNLKVAA